jgi:hypothetical protein
MTTRVVSQVVTQRWSSPGPDERSRSSFREAGQLFSWKRLGLECMVVGLLLLWLYTGSHIFASRYDECRTHSGGGQESRASFVSIRSLSGNYQWQAASSGVLGIARGAATNVSFHLEWRDDAWFCLRSLADLRVVQVEPAGSAHAGVLRTAGYGCSSDAHLFQYKGRSIYSKGAGSYINARELKFLRAHGDTMPWRAAHRTHEGAAAAACSVRARARSGSRGSSSPLARLSQAVAAPRDAGNARGPRADAAAARPRLHEPRARAGGPPREGGRRGQVGAASQSSRRTARQKSPVTAHQSSNKAGLRPLCGLCSDTKFSVLP